jgi:hypothetical protein
MNTNTEQLGFSFAPMPKPKVQGKARNTDPEPAHDAATMVNASAQRAMIVKILTEANGRKLTVKEIADIASRGRKTPIQANAISPRFAPMEREGILERGSKEERQAYKSNVKCDVWGLKNSNKLSYKLRDQVEG